MYDVDSHPSETLLNDYVLGTLRDPDADSLEKHLSACDECSAIAQELQPRDSLMDLLASAASSSFDRYSSATVATVNASRVSTSMCGTVLADQTIDSTDDEPIPAPLLNHTRYRVLRMLGRGGMGCVWLAEHLVLRRQVALKMLRVDWMQKPSTIERFDREIRAAAKLNHPNVAAVYDAEQIGESHFLVMEYVEGETLSELLRIGPMPVAEACRAIRDAAKGLAHAHAAQLIHRDVKPGNMIRTPTGDVKILDFGLVVSPQETTSLTGPSMVMGTPDYIAPEQAEDPHAADERSDIYSLGCTFYHLLAGHAPYPGGSVLQKLDAHRTKLPPEVPGLSPAVWSVVKKMMQRNPSERFQNAGEIAIALPDAMCGITSPNSDCIEPQIAMEQRLVPPRKRLWRMVMALGSLFMALLICGAYIIQTSTGELIIETKENDVNVVVKQRGEVVAVIDKKTGNRLRLKAGIYELDPETSTHTIDDSQLLIDNKTVELKRNEVVIATVSKRPKSAKATESSSTNDVIATTASGDSMADGSVRFSLLAPTSLGQGIRESYKVEADILKLDSIRAPHAVWLNFAYAPGSTLRVKSRFRFIECNDEGAERFIKVAFLSYADNNEYNIEVNREGQTLLATLCYWENNKRNDLGESVSISLADGEWATLQVQLTPSKLEVMINEVVAATYSGTLPGPRYPAIASKNTIAELQNPHVIVDP